MYVMRHAMLLVLGFLIGSLVMCDQGGEGIVGPERHDAPVAWRGAQIDGVRPVEAEPRIEAGYQRLAPHAGGWEPRGWTITLHEELIQTPTRTTCGGEKCPPVLDGVTDRRARAIHLSWAGGEADLVEDACWELSNAALNGRDQDFPWCGS